MKGWTLVTGQRSNRGFYGSSYEGGPGVTDKTFLQCDLWGFCPRTLSEELSVLLILPLLGLLFLGRALLSSPVLLPFYTGIYFPFNIHASVSLSGVETCPISPYLEWLRVIVKSE